MSSFLDAVKSIPITGLAEQMGYTLVRKGKYFSIKEHDSVIIDTQKNCFWRNSKFAKGFRGGSGSCIDFFMEFTGEMDCKRAIYQIAQMYGIEGNKWSGCKDRSLKTEAQKECRKNETEQRIAKITLPPQNDNNERVWRYLVERGISKNVINYFFERKMLYEDKRLNCVFVSPNRDFACIRSTGNKRFVRDCEGSNYDQCFFFKGRMDAQTLYVAESVIDIMSVMTYLKSQKKWYGNYAYLALSGTNKIHSLFVHLKQEPRIKEVILCCDQDEGGKNADLKAIQGMKEMNFLGKWKIQKPPVLGVKDWNDYIKSLLYGEGENL